MNLKYEKKSGYEYLDNSEGPDMKDYLKRYMSFISKCKTEWECAEYIENVLVKNGFVNIAEKKDLVAGDKVYFVNKEKSLFATVIGKEGIEKGLNIVGGHIDSPRLDLKPMPLFEKDGMAYLKTVYYGGIKKYQWVTMPLAMHGIVYDENGKKINIVVGEEDDEPCFTIADLLPHYAADQMKMTAGEFIDPEKLTVIVGSIKDDEAEGDKVKMNILKILNEKYGIKEIDFMRSEIEFVPAYKARFIGFDNGLIGAYGQDDRVCSYATIEAILNVKDNEKTVVAMIVDKEEIGSVGITGMKSQAFDMYMDEIIRKCNINVDLNRVYYNSKMLSADVTGAIDVSSEDVMDYQNSAILGCGISLEKYTGGRGKSNGSEASAKYLSQVSTIFDENKISYQATTLGKIEKGGGGTIAYILANKGVDVVDCGTPVLSMHSPYEVSSVVDVYMTYKAYKAFFESK